MHEEVMMRPKKVWILLADGGNARFIERVRPSGKLLEIQSLTHSHDLTHEHGRDRPGRGFGPGAAYHHAYEPHGDWHEQQRDNFAKEIVQVLNKAHTDKKFDELYILAPPKMLGLIRQHVTTHADHKMRAKITREISKDETHFTLNDIQKSIDGNPEKRF